MRLPANTPGEMRDDLRPARGIAASVAIGLGMWAALIAWRWPLSLAPIEAVAGVGVVWGGGCGTRTRDQLARWFTQTERKRLKALGYRVVLMTADEIVAESEHQVVFWRKRPLARDGLVIPWGDIPTLELANTPTPGTRDA